MDRRQRKTREQIFNAFTELLKSKSAERITVGEIIEKADVGRATFYAHFPTKDYLIKELNEELFCHVFDSLNVNNIGHRHIFGCEGVCDVTLHLFKHFLDNDNGILDMLCCPNNELFVKYFKSGLIKLIENASEVFSAERSKTLPSSFWVNHLASAFVETVRWWIDNGRKESAEEINNYYLTVLNV